MLLSRTIFFSITLSLFFLFTLSAEEKLISLSFGPVQIGQAKIPLDLEHFRLHIKGDERIKATFIPDSVQWIRTSGNMLTPRARIKITVDDHTSHFFLKYFDKPITLLKGSEGYSAELFIPLFNPGEVEIFEKTKKIATLRIQVTPPKDADKTQLIDYTCDQYNLQFAGLDNDYITVGCRLERIGKWGYEVPRLEVTWTTTNYQLPDGTKPPYLSLLSKGGVAETEVVDASMNQKIIKISADLPSRLHRIKTAIGFGPYLFESEQKEEKRPYKVAPSFMLYGNLFLTPTTSLRAFDAILWQETLFNNFGFYFAYELADAFDGRISLVPLLGIQGLTFKYHQKDSLYTRLIYPQGFELTYKHAFNLKNYNLIYGMFFSPTNSDDYRNLWLRFGKGHFWELNYISWATNAHTKGATMFGLSVGIPFFSFF